MTMDGPDEITREQQWRRLALRADSILSLLRHRGGITWGGPLPESSEVDAVIGALRTAHNRGDLPDANNQPVNILGGAFQFVAVAHAILWDGKGRLHTDPFLVPFRGQQMIAAWRALEGQRVRITIERLDPPT